MKYLNVPISPLAFLVVVLILASCTKEDTEKQIKESIILSLVKEINADSLRADVVWLQNMGTRFALGNNHRSVALKIQNRFIQMGYSNAKVDSFAVNKIYRDIDYEQWQYNVIAFIEGTKYPDSLCLIGGHYDNILKDGDPFIIVPGANDNASGTAASLEIARVMKKNRFSPQNTVMFVAFGGEEIGLWGSRDFADNGHEFSKKIKFMLNNDMIAYEPEYNPSQWLVNIIDYDNSHDLRIDAEKICERFTLLGFRNDNTHYKQSDSYPFFLNAYKALFFTSDKTDPNYHTMNDVSANCNFDYCREIVKISCALLADKN